MPIKKSAMKSIRQDEKRRARNLAVRLEIKKTIKISRKAIAEKKADKANEAIKKAIKILDKAVQGKKIKKNTAARKKSRLMKALNSIKS